MRSCVRIFGIVQLALFVSKEICAYDFKVDGLCYNILSDNTVELTWEAVKSPYTGDIVVPNNVTFNGNKYDVVAIGDYAFLNLVEKTVGSAAWQPNANLYSVVLPESIIKIGETAFSSCSSLASITIPNSVESIGSRAFSSCGGITSITIPNSVTSIGLSAFSGCYNLTSIKVASDNTLYDSRNDCNAIIETSTNKLIEGCKRTTIPNSVTSIGSNALNNCYGLTSITIPNSVISIGNQAFYGCTSLTSITIPNSVTSIGNQAFYKTAWYTNQPDGIVYAGQFAYAYKGDMPENTTISLKEGTTGIADMAFFDCSGLTSITIPNSVTSIGWYAFDGCSGLTSINIPNSVTFIGEYAFVDCSGLTSIIVESGNTKYDSRDNCNAIIETASNTLKSGCKNTIIPSSVTSIGDLAFRGCSGLTSITIPNSVTTIVSGAFLGSENITSVISKIQNPFAIFGCFNDDIYSKATLTIPQGTKAAYQVTEGWNKFVNIVEDGTTDELLFTIDGTTYQGSGSNKTAQVKSVDTKLRNLVIPASVSYNGTSYQVTGIADNAFSGSTMAALIWNVDAALPSNTFSNASIGSNFLLYVKSESYAPLSVKNVVVNGTAQAIVLSDNGGQFYCPHSFTARSISYTHSYSMETGGAGKGWETIALPFYVQKISHATHGEIIPFASYSSGSNQKPFWLASMSDGRFWKSSKIEANTPYIIAMPNNSSYRNDYILAGDVTFSSENVSVPATPTFSRTFVPTYSTVTKSSNVYALNVNNRYLTYSGNYDAGSRFISNLRDVRPFEAYLSVGSSTRGVIEIGFSDGTTGMADVIGAFDADRPIDIYTLSGQKVAQTKQSEIDNILNQLPHGVYIVNGKKIVK